MPLEDIIPGHAAQMRSGETGSNFITETQLKNPTPKLLPLDSDLRQFFSALFNDINPNILVETIYLYKKPEYCYTNSESWDTAQKTGIFNQLLAVSSLTGIQYFSTSRGTMRTFIEYSSVIDGPDTKLPLPDPVYSTLPDDLVLYVRQTDATFKENTYIYSYKTGKNGIFLIQENFNTLTFALLPVIGKGNLKTIIAVYDCGDSLLIYSVSMARALSVPGTSGRISASFQSRVEAVLKWFTGRADNFF